MHRARFNKFAVKYNKGEARPRLIYYENHVGYLTSSGHIPSNIGIARRACHYNNNKLSESPGHGAGLHALEYYSNMTYLQITLTYNHLVK